VGNFDERQWGISVSAIIADSVELCLIGAGGDELRVPVTEVDDDVWHIYLPNVGPGQCYGYRVGGPLNPGAGQRCDPTKFLLDPYAKAIDNSGLTGAAAAGSDHNMTGVVVHPTRFDWGGDTAPSHAYCDTVIYETHMRGMTKTLRPCPSSCVAPTRGWPTPRSSTISPRWASTPSN